jgi:hypothetical protein
MLLPSASAGISKIFEFLENKWEMKTKRKSRDV